MRINQIYTKSLSSTYIDNITPASGGWESTQASVLANSGGWESTKSTVVSNSANWDDARSTVVSNSANWDDARSTVVSNSAGWETTESVVVETSAKWNNVRSTVLSNSGGWEATESRVVANSGKWNTLYATSGNWDKVRSTVLANSAGWESTESTVVSNSANWQNAAISGMMVGTIIQWPSKSSLPSNYLRCTRAAISRSEYSELSAILGTSYGSDSATTFRLPTDNKLDTPVFVMFSTDLIGGDWYAMTSNFEGTIYVEDNAGGNLYQKRNSDSAFVALSSGIPLTDVYQMATSPTGDLFIIGSDGGGNSYLYVNRYGKNSLTEIVSSDTYPFRGVTVDRNNTVYVSASGDGVWYQPNGTGEFSKSFSNTKVGRLCAHPNGYVYLCQTVGTILRSDPDIGDFTEDIGPASKSWIAICVAPNGDIWASATDGSLYVQPKGADNAALGYWRPFKIMSTSDAWYGMAFSQITFDMYVCKNSFEIYRYEKDMIPVIRCK